MHNDLFHIGKITIHGYGLMIAVGVLVATFISMFRAKKKKMDMDPILDIILIILIGGFLGGKLLYIIVDWKNFIAAENKLAYFGGSGFVVYGGIILALVVNLIYLRLRKKNFLEYFDLIAPSVSIAQGFGRIGCLLAGCCYGRITTMDKMHIIFPEGSLCDLPGVPLVPTQIIMSVGNFIIGGILFLLDLKLKRRGQVGACYLILYAAGRFAVEFLRFDHRGSVGVFSTSQFISIFIFVIGVALLVYSSVKGKKRGEE